MVTKQTEITIYKTVDKNTKNTHVTRQYNIHWALPELYIGCVCKIQP